MPPPLRSPLEQRIVANRQVARSGVRSSYAGGWHGQPSTVTTQTTTNLKTHFSARRAQGVARARRLTETPRAKAIGR